MAKTTPGQFDFSGGEFSPLLKGRVEAERYATGLDTLENYVPLLQGPLVRRPGSIYRGYSADVGNVTGRLHGFQFSTTQAYMLVFTNNKIQIYFSDGTPVVAAAQSITGITQANPAVVTYSGADNYANGDEVILSGIVGMTELNGRRFIVANVDTGANTFELTTTGGANVNSTGYTAYSSGGSVEEIVTVTTTYTTAQLFDLKLVQSADVLYIVHPSHAPAKLTRTSHVAWTLADVSFVDGPYDILNPTSTTITPSATTGSGITLTASAVTGINDDTGFQTTDVGRMVRLRHTSTWGYAVITGHTSTTIVTADVVKDFGATTATAFWRLGLSSDTTGYPAATTFHDDRLWYGGWTSYPQTIAGSKTSNYDDMSPTETDATVNDDNGMTRTLQSDDVQAVRWMVSTDDGLLVGTVSSEFLVEPSENSAGLTPTDSSAKPVTYHGSKNIQPVQAEKSTIFVQRAGKKLRELNSMLSNKFVAPDITQVAEHITKGGVTQLAYQQEPYNVVWAVRADGTLVSFTFERDAQGGLKAAGARHILGGTSDANGTQAVVVSAAVLPSSDGTTDVLWVLVKRYINGVTVHCVETIEFQDPNNGEPEDYVFLDSCAIYDGAATTAVSGLWHLEGETVGFLTDGYTQPDATIAAGQATLADSASVIHTGYNFDSKIKLLRWDVGSPAGTSIGKRRRVNHLAIQFSRSMSMNTGSSFSDVKPIIFRTPADPTGQAVPLFTGLKRKTFDGPTDFDNNVCLLVNRPFPSNILAIMPDMNTETR